MRSRLGIPLPHAIRIGLQVPASSVGSRSDRAASHVRIDGFGNGDEEGAATSSASHEPLNQTGEKEKVTPTKRPSQRPMSSKPSKNPMSGMSDWRRDIVRSQN